MDMIEYAILCLGWQARAIGEIIPATQATQGLLNEAAESLERAAGARHDSRSSPLSESDRHLGERPFADTPEEQMKQISEVEKHLARDGHPVRINRGPTLIREGGEKDDLALLRLVGELVSELRDRGMIRSVNRPLAGDYAEALVAVALEATRPAGPDRGVDLERRSAEKVELIQVKARRDPEGRTASHFDITNLPEARFHTLVAVVFDQHFSVRKAWKLPVELAAQLARPSGRKHRVRIVDLEGALAAGKDVQDISEELRAAALGTGSND